MKILLVEDAKSVLAFLKAQLSYFGYEVILAENGQIAVDLFRKSAPDLVLMDIEMPVMNGFEAASHIRAIEATQQWAWTPIIFLTASDKFENLVTAIEAGGDDYIVKSAPQGVLQAKMKAMARIAMLRQRLSEANHKLDELANLDGLTGLCNRRNMDLRVDAEWERAVSQRTAFGLLMLDIDNFKKYNDAYGHQTGDECLKSFSHEVANVLEDMKTRGIIQTAFAARYGGEEFAVILPAISNDAYSVISNAIVEAIRLLSIPHRENTGWEIVTVSIGGARVDVASGKVKDLFRIADERLYRAKQLGRNRAEIN